MELLRLLQHARGCDGQSCPQCEKIDLRLGDWPHGTEDPALRLDKVDAALVACLSQAERLYGVLEGASLPASTRQVAVQLCTWLGKTRELLVLPVTRGDDAPVPVPRKRTAAVFDDHGAVVVTTVWGRRPK
jgi:hypothetical protein